MNKSKRSKSILSLITAMTLLTGVIYPALPAGASRLPDPETQVAARFQDVQDTVVVPVTEDPDPALSFTYAPQSASQAASSVTKADSRYWKQFNSGAILSYLTRDEKELYRRYEEACIAVMSDTATDFPGTSIYVDVSDRSLGDHLDPAQLNYMFKLSYPQYFILSNSIGYSFGYIYMYPEFQSAAFRSAAVNEFRTTVDAWVAQANAAVRPEEKEKAAHDLLCANCYYDSAATDQHNMYDGTTRLIDWDQGAYSVIHDGKTVCAGYAAVSGILLSALGLKVLNPTGSGHAWNVVGLHGSWYLYDATWDDLDDAYGDVCCYVHYNAPGVDPDGSYVGGHTPEFSAHADWEHNLPVQNKYSNVPLDYDGPDGNHAEVYFTVGDYTYFVTNGYSDYGAFTAELVGCACGSVPTDRPQTVTWLDKTYQVTYAGAEDGGNDDSDDSDGQDDDDDDDRTPIPDDEREALIRAFVSRMYTQALGREAEPAGLVDWSSQLMAHTNDGAGLAYGFIMSDEFQRRALPDEAYLTTLYHTFFDREPDESGYNNWMNALAKGAGRASVLAGFVNSDEFGNLCKRYGIVRGTMREDGSVVNAGIRAFVERMYLKCLGRAGEEDGIVSWTNRIANGEWQAGDVAKVGFFCSEEYRNKHTDNDTFVKDMYHAFFDREPDEGGYNNWFGKLERGADRLEIIYGFTDSEEFGNLLRSYGL
jgi:hypothetical protein